MTTIQPQRRSPARIAVIVISVVVLVIGVCLAVGGGVLLLVFGSGGSLKSGTHAVSTPTAAVVTDTAQITDTSRLTRALGDPSVSVHASGGNGSGLFIGIGPAADVDRYLTGVAIEQARDFNLDPFALDAVRRDGTALASPPATQPFWVASGATDVTWPITDGDYRAVVMNADGTPGVDSRLAVDLNLPGLFGYALWFFIAGLVLMAAAIVALALGRPRNRAPMSPAPAPPRY
ncbi:hypothetical protein VSH64_15035 [Amycolatopsis rhabdoformis]|uniref:DUF3153 domain-containing protein n=1 Tax=Amycolatopsis rhabdoformis TaxID=1448059 RepID=A0ABZ1IJ23_9PSEU|nr:hypothetical protein [Amycolatopsis rhabdoformis]WSE33415.1 hypothetical protein VSH64_15035 [Amycolatopsis rhabdoformis]